MAKRALYIAAYDIRSPRRLAAALQIIKEFATGGQKSAYECFLGHTERRELLQRVEQVIERGEDRFFLLRLNRKPRVHTLGIAVQPQDLDFFYQG